MHYNQREGGEWEKRCVRFRGEERGFAERGRVDEGVTERKLEGSRGDWEGASAEGIVSCHRGFVP